MARVQLDSQAWGVVWDVNGNALVGLTVTLQLVGSGTNATHWSAVTSGTSSTSVLTTDTEGLLTFGGLVRYVEEGTYNMTVGGVTRRVEATAGATVVSVGGSVAAVRSNRVYRPSDYDIGSGSLADMGPNIQAMVDDIAAEEEKGGVGELPSGYMKVNTPIVWPNGKVVRLRGGGNSGSGPIFGTVLERTSGTGSIIKALGTSSAVSARAHVQLEHLGLSGGALNGDPVLDLQRCQHVNLHQVRVSNCGLPGALGAARGVFMTSLWDCTIIGFIVETSGNGETYPAWEFNAAAGESPAEQGGAATVHVSHYISQANLGTDLKLSGHATNGPTNDVRFSNVKMETAITIGASTTFPWIDLADAQNCGFDNLKISAALNRDGPFVRQDGTDRVHRGNTITNFCFDASPAAGIARFVDHGKGTLILGDGSMVGVSPTSEYTRIKSTVEARRHKQRNVYFSDVATPAFSDLRTINEELGKVSVRVFPARANGNAGVADLGYNTAYDFDAAADEWSTGQVEVPRDAVPGRPGILRLRWTAAAITGNVMWRVNYASQPEFYDLNAGTVLQSQALFAAPGTTNRQITAELAMSGPFAPGDTVVIYLRRMGTDGTDTMAGDARLVSAHVVFERAV